MPQINSDYNNRLQSELTVDPNQRVGGREIAIISSAKEALATLGASFEEAPTSLEDHAVQVIPEEGSDRPASSPEQKEKTSLLKNLGQRPATRSYEGKEDQLKEPVAVPRSTVQEKADPMDSPPSYPAPEPPEESVPLPDGPPPNEPPPPLPTTHERPRSLLRNVGERPATRSYEPPKVETRNAETPSPLPAKKSRRFASLRSGLSKAKTAASKFLGIDAKPKATASSTANMMAKLSSTSETERKMAVEELANELKTSNLELLQKVRSEEFDARKFDSTQLRDLAEAPNLHNLAKQQEAIQSMVKHQILTGTMPTEEGKPRLLEESERKQLIESFIEAADISAKDGDFLTANAISAALNSSELTPVMNNTEISSESKQNLDKLSKLHFQKTYFETVNERKKNQQAFIPAPGPTFTSITQKTDQTVTPDNLVDPFSDANQILDSFPEGKDIRTQIMRSGEAVSFDALVRTKHKSDLKYAQEKSNPNESKTNISTHLSELRNVGKFADQGLESIRKKFSAYFKGDSGKSSLKKAVEKKSVRSKAHILGYTAQKQGLRVEIAGLNAKEQKEFALGQQEAMNEQNPDSLFFEADIDPKQMKSPNERTRDTVTRDIISYNTAAFGSNCVLRKYSKEDNDAFVSALEAGLIYQVQSDAKLSELSPLAKAIKIGKNIRDIREKIGGANLTRFYNDADNSAKTGRVASKSTDKTDHRIVDDFKKTELTEDERALLIEARNELTSQQMMMKQIAESADSSPITQATVMSVEINIKRMINELDEFI